MQNTTPLQALNNAGALFSTINKKLQILYLQNMLLWLYCTASYQEKMTWFRINLLAFKVQYAIDVKGLRFTVSFFYRVNHLERETVQNCHQSCVTVACYDYCNTLLKFGLHKQQFSHTLLVFSYFLKYNIFFITSNSTRDTPPPFNVHWMLSVNKPIFGPFDVDS